MNDSICVPVYQEIIRSAIKIRQGDCRLGGPIDLYFGVGILTGDVDTASSWVEVIHINFLDRDFADVHTIRSGIAIIMHRYENRMAIGSELVPHCTMIGRIYQIAVSCDFAEIPACRTRIGQKTV